MMKRTAILLTLCAACAIAVVLFLFFNISQEHDNGFTRNLRPMIAANPRYVDLKVNSWYIAGNDAGHIYLGNYVAPDHLLIVDLASLDTTYVKLKLNTNAKMTIPQMFVRVDSPFIYLFYGKAGLILRGSLGHHELDEFISQKQKFYAHFGIPVSSTSFIVKTYDQVNKQYVLSKMMKGQLELLHNRQSLVKQVDGSFCTEGLIAFDKINGKIVFNYVYRNAYTSFDTALHIIGQSHTIDTNWHAKIKVKHLESENQTVFSAPPLAINTASSICNQILYLSSNLQASNEDTQAYRANSVIDVYDLKLDHYLFSFYVPDFNNNKLSGIAVINQHAFVLQGQYLSRYAIGP